MAVINFANREITAKIVYYGNEGAGTSSNLKSLHRRLQPDRTSHLHHFGPEGEEPSWYFEFHPSDGPLTGFKPDFQVYSFTTAMRNDAHRAEVIRGVDAVVFVADARQERNAANIDGLVALEKALAAHGVELAAMTVVIQVNHTDAPSARPAKDVVFDLNPYGFVVHEARADSGSGVLETFEEVSAALLARIRDNLSGNSAAITLTAVHRTTAMTPHEVLQGHLEVLRQSGVPVLSSVEQVLEDPTDFHRLPEGPVIEVPVKARGIVGHQPVAILDAKVEGTRAVIELVLDKPTGGNLRRLTVVLVQESTAEGRDDPSVPLASTPQPISPAPIHITKDLPDSISLTPQRHEPESNDLPGVIYGMLGVLSGLLLGLLLGFLLFY